MVITLPGTPWNYRASATNSNATGTVCIDAGDGRAYLLNAIVAFDASGAGKWWMFAGTTATIMVGPFYPTTCGSWILSFGPMGLPTSATSLDIGYVFSTTGNYNIVANGYVV